VGAITLPGRLRAPCHRELLTVCTQKGWHLQQVRHYTGFPSLADNPHWYAFWTNKQAAMARQGVHTFGRPLKYRSQPVEWPDRTPVLLPDGKPYVRQVGQEKGIDIRIALDVVHLALEQAYEAAILFTQDRDLSEAVGDVKAIARLQKRWLTLVTAFPDHPGPDHDRRGLDGTDWKRIAKEEYDACLDPQDYRPRRAGF